MKNVGPLLMAVGLAAFMPYAIAKKEYPTTMQKQESAEVDRVIKSVKPRYPLKAVRESIEGWVKLSVDVNEQGAVTKVKVVDAHPPRIFEKEAIESMEQWQFQSKTLNGKAVPYQVSQTIEFELKNFDMASNQ